MSILCPSIGRASYASSNEVCIIAKLAGSHMISSRGGFSFVPSRQLACSSSLLQIPMYTAAVSINGECYTRDVALTTFRRICIFSQLLVPFWDDAHHEAPTWPTWPNFPTTFPLDLTVASKFPAHHRGRVTGTQVLRPQGSDTVTVPCRCKIRFTYPTDVFINYISYEIQVTMLPHAASKNIALTRNFFFEKRLPEIQRRFGLVG